MRRIRIILLIALFTGLFTLISGCKGESMYKVQNAYITIDINPSVEIITGEDGLVAQVNALNDDAETLLVDSDFTGQPVDLVTETILTLAAEMGYLSVDDDNAIIITAEAGAENITEELEKTLAEKVQEFIQAQHMRTEVIQARFAASEDMIQEAENLGISIGKLKMITFAMAFNDDLTVEAGAAMSIRNLNKVIQAGRNEIREFYSVELKGTFFKEKQDLQIALYKAIVSLYNQTIQNADSEVFASLLDEETNVEEVKALYQEYSDMITTFERIPESNQENTELKAQIETLKAQYEVLYEALKNLLRNYMSKSRVERNAIKEQIAQVKEQLHELNEQLRSLYSELPANLRGGKGFRFSLKGFILEYVNKNEDIKALKEITKTYRREFSKINVDMESFEALFTEELQPEIDKLINAYEVDLEAVKNDILSQAVIIKDQLKKEKNALREIWKKNAQE